MEHNSVPRQKVKSSAKKAKKRRRRTNLAHRIKSVLLVLGGLSAVKVGRKFGDSPRAVANWVRRFKKGGIRGLEDAPHTGRPPTITPERAKKLRAYMARTRAQSKSLSGRAVAEYIKESFGVALTRQQARRILNRLGS
ncbi:MAG TPA: helix-turn-helix domain-containing protein [Opitutaceae bacterium]|nr:helix-turn-helix domain-containing protein [Opitutaceae bacterium]